MLGTYSRVHNSSDGVFSKILKKPSIVQKEIFGFWVVQKIFFFFLNEKHQGGSYEVAFTSALWMVSSES